MYFSTKASLYKCQAAETQLVTKPRLGQGILGSIKVFKQLQIQHLLRRP